MVDTSCTREEDSPMAKPTKSKAKHRQAVKALDAAEVPHQEFGKLNQDGTPKIDFKSLEEFKKKVGKAAFANVRFRALNAPFKRRSAIPSG
jgi:hypothetical protein